MKSFKELIKESVKSVKEEEKKVDKPWKVLNKETKKVVKSFPSAHEAEAFISNSKDGNKKYFKDYKKADGKMVGEEVINKSLNEEPMFKGKVDIYNIQNTIREIKHVISQLEKAISNGSNDDIIYWKEELVDSVKELK